MKLLVVLITLIGVVFTQTVPPQDQCKSVSAQEPPECPNHIGPPCPPCYTNTEADYQTGDSITFSSTDQVNIENTMQGWINYWLTNYPPSRNYPFGDYNIFTGLAGRGQLFLRLYKYTGNDTYFTYAKEYVTHALQVLPKEDQYPSYFFGFLGVYVIQAIICDLEQNATGVDYYQNQIISIFDNVNNAINNGGKTNYRLDIGGIDEGMAGLIYGGLLTNSYFGEDIVDPMYIQSISYYTIELGMQNGQKNGNNWMQYECPFLAGCYMIGMGHGSGGVIKTLFSAFELGYLPDLFTNPTYLTALQNTLNHLVNVQLPDGNMPTVINGTCYEDYGNDSDARVQWCHGAPGFIDVFLSASYYWQTYNIDSDLSQTYMNSGLRCSDATWNRGLLVKGLMYCHGIGGNSYMLQSQYQILSRFAKQLGGNPIFDDFFKSFGKTDMSDMANEGAWRAKEFITWTLDPTNTAALRCVDSNENYSFFQGCPGIVALYIQALQDGWPSQIEMCMPGWNMCY